MSNEKKHLSWYDSYLQERADILAIVPNKTKEKVETSLTLFVIKNMKEHKGKYFSHSHLTDNPLFKKYFNILGTSGDRNMGKTTDGKSECENEVRKGNKFIWLRSQQGEIEEWIKAESEDGGWLHKNGWEFKNTKSPNIYNSLGELVGYARDVNTISKFKSIEFPGVSLTVYDEFNSEVRISNKFKKLTKFLVTVQRHRDNFRLLLISNYVDYTDDILQNLGLGMEGHGNSILKFDWISGSILWFIPKDTYKTFSDKSKSVGYRMSLNNPESFKSQFGGGFKGGKLTNVIDYSKIIDKKLLFNMVFSVANEPLKASWYLARMFNHEKNELEEFIYVTHLIVDDSSDVINYVLSDKDAVRFINTIKINPMELKNVVELWMDDYVKTDNKESLTMLTYIMDAIVKDWNSRTINGMREIKSI